MFSKEEIFQVLDMADTDITRNKLYRISKVYDVSIVSLILLNVLVVILETVEGLATGYPAFFRVFEFVSSAVFTIEYALRLWSCTSEEGFKHAIKGRLKYAKTPLAIFDLLAIIPFYLPFIISADLSLFRLARLFRIFKIARYVEPLQRITEVIKNKKTELYASFGVVVFLLIFASTLMYYFEHKAQPEAFSSIPAAMWWGVATLTTVGYGDVYPITAVGKVAAAIISIVGIGAFGLPAGILASGLMQLNEKNKKCPHCGEGIE